MTHSKYWTACEICKGSYSGHQLLCFCHLSLLLGTDPDTSLPKRWCLGVGFRIKATELAQAYWLDSINRWMVETMAKRLLRWEHFTDSSYKSLGLAWEAPEQTAVLNCLVSSYESRSCSSGDDSSLQGFRSTTSNSVSPEPCRVTLSRPPHSRYQSSGVSMPERASSKIINVSSVAEGWQDVRASRTCSLNTVPHFPHPFPTPSPPGASISDGTTLYTRETEKADLRKDAKNISPGCLPH